MADATAHYERREEELGSEVLRQVERQVMLRIIDQRWREHLEEMDYLQGGINLRAMGQKDPLVEWQREGFEMFGVDDDRHRPGLRQVRDARPGRPEPAGRIRPRRRRCRTCRRVRPTTTRSAASIVRARAAVAEGELPPEAAPAPAAAKQQTVVKDDFSKTPRNAPCPCGSGKKFKLCHGAT